MRVTVLIAAGGLLLAALPPLAALPLPEHPAWLVHLAYQAERWGWMPVAALLAVAAVRAWPRPRRPSRIALVGWLALCLWAATNRQLEWWFPAAGTPQVAVITDPRAGSGRERVLGVNVDGVKRAYLVRYLAFHHLLNERLNGVPILPTY